MQSIPHDYGSELLDSLLLRRVLHAYQIKINKFLDLRETNFSYKNDFKDDEEKCFEFDFCSDV